jgi:hypothetical protein
MRRRDECLWTVHGSYLVGDSPLLTWQPCHIFFPPWGCTGGSEAYIANVTEHRSS